MICPPSFYLTTGMSILYNNIVNMLRKVSMEVLDMSQREKNLLMAVGVVVVIYLIYLIVF